MAIELKDFKVTVVSLWPGTVKTEAAYEWLQSGMLSKMAKMPQVFRFKGMSYNLDNVFLPGI